MIPHKGCLSQTGVHCEPTRVMCQGNVDESHFHLFFQCNYAKRIWSYVQNGLNTRLLARAVLVSNRVPPRAALQRMWKASAREATGSGGMAARLWLSAMLCTVWGIWRQRNSKIFNDELVQPHVLGHKVIQEAKLWLKFC